MALAEHAIPPAPTLFRLPGLPAVQQELYAACDFATVATLPWAEATPARPFTPPGAPARTIDLRDFALDPAFRGVAMIDYFLALLCVDSALLAPARRRNAWLAPRLRRIAESPTARGSGALLCPTASMALRTMPPAFARALAAILRRAGLRPRRQHAAPSLAALCAQVTAAALVVSTDTAMVHLADALGVPCIAFFVTHRPEWRMRDYPLCHAIHLPAPALPPALEFARGPADLAAAAAAWFPPGRDPGWLEATMHAALHDLETRRRASPPG